VKLALLTVSILIYLIVTMFVPVAVQAQGPGTPPAGPTPAPTTSADDALAQAQRLDDKASLALNTLNTALSVVGFVGFAVAVIGGIFSYFGLRNYMQQRDELRAELADARNIINNANTSLDEIRRFHHETEQNLDALKGLREQISQDLEATDKRSHDVTQALAHAQLGQQQILIGNLNAALTSLETACKFDPDNRVIRYFLGDVHVRLERLEDGIEHLKKAIEGDDFPAANVSYAYALRLRGDNETDPTRREMWYAEATAIFLKEFTKNPELMDISGESAYGALAGLYRRQGRIDKAIEIYEHAQNSYPVNNLAILNYLRGNREEARKYFEMSQDMANQKLVSRRSDYWTWFDLITAKVALESDRDEIARDLESAIKLAPGVKPLEKLLLGIEELVSIPNGPTFDELVMDRLKAEIARRKSGEAAA
jgi:tetratricopeptide (TPR) repeat protein